MGTGKKTLSTRSLLSTAECAIPVSNTREQMCVLLTANPVKRWAETWELWVSKSWLTLRPPSFYQRIIGSNFEFVCLLSSFLWPRSTPFFPFSNLTPLPFSLLLSRFSTTCIFCSVWQVLLFLSLSLYLCFSLSLCLPLALPVRLPLSLSLSLSLSLPLSFSLSFSLLFPSLFLSLLLHPSFSHLSLSLSLYLLFTSLFLTFVLPLSFSLPPPPPSLSPSPPPLSLSLSLSFYPLRLSLLTLFAALKIPYFCHLSYLRPALTFPWLTLFPKSHWRHKIFFLFPCLRYIVNLIITKNTTNCTCWWLCARLAWYCYFPPFVQHRHGSCMQQK